MARPKNPQTVLAQLKKAGCFSTVNFSDFLEESGEAIYLAAPKKRLRHAMLEQLRPLDLGGKRGPADNEIASVFRDVLAPHLPTDLDLAVEIEFDYGYFPGEPVAPEQVELIVRIPRAEPSRRPRRVDRRRRSTPDMRGLTDTERKEAIRLDDERKRSRDRRADAKAKREHETGKKVRIGKAGYVVKEYDEEGRAFWVPNPDARAVMREVDRVWMKSITSGAVLAHHLNEKAKLKPLAGKTFKRNMMTRLTRALEKLRRSDAVRRLHGSTR